MTVKLTVKRHAPCKGKGCQQGDCQGTGYIQFVLCKQVPWALDPLDDHEFGEGAKLGVGDLVDLVDSTGTGVGYATVHHIFATSPSGYGNHCGIELMGFTKEQP